MAKIVKNRFDNWEVSLLSFKIGKLRQFKVTRRFPQLNVADTRIFDNIDDAKKQFDDWTD